MTHLKSTISSGSTRFLRRLPCLLAALLPLAAACGSDEPTYVAPTTGRPPCASNNDCPNPEPYCVAGRCVQCTESGPCGNPDQLCDLVTYQCKVACSAAAECGGQLCAPRGVCVNCIGDTDCTSGNERFCDTALDRCIECRADLDCNADHRYCNLERSHCVECRSNLDCPGGTCTDGGDCEIPCFSDAQCGGKKPACSLSTGTCVECLADSYCPADKPGCRVSDLKCSDCSIDLHCATGTLCNVAEGKCE